MKNPTSYDLSRSFWNWAFENPELIRPQHSAIYFFAIEHCNRLGWKEKFGFPSQMTMDAIGISKYQTYIKYFNDLIEFGFLNLVQKSKNQYSANIISLNYALPKNGKALDKALIKHGVKQTQKQLESNHDSDGSIVKQQTNKQTNNKPPNKISGLKNIFTKFYKLKIDSEYIYTNDDDYKFNSLYDKIKKTIEGSNLPIEEDTIENSFQAILDNLPEWFESKLSVSIINSQYNRIISEIKNPNNEQNATDKKFKSAFDNLPNN